MVIYLAQGYIGNKLQEAKTELSDFEAIRHSKVQTLTDIEKVEQYKSKEIHYFVAGKFKKNIRNNENLIHKTLIVLDFDDVDLTKEEFIRHLKNSIGRYRYYAYPSIQDGLKGLRYRVVIDINRPYTIAENGFLMAYVKRIIGLVEYDDSSNTFSQLQSLKCTFGSKEAYEERCFYNEGDKLDVDHCISLQKQWEKESPEKATRSDNKPNFKIEYQRKKKYTASFMEELMEGVDIGGRDVWITKQFGRMLALGIDYTPSYKWIELINREFVRPPVSDSQLNKIVLSIVNSEKLQMEKTRKEGFT